MSTIKANTLLHSDGTTTTQPSIPALDQRMAKAWVNFNGTGTVAINSSYNVSSITDHAIGDYSMNFANSMSDANYSATGMASTNAIAGTMLEKRTNVAQTSNAIRVSSRKLENSNIDAVYVCVQVFGN